MINRIYRLVGTKKIEIAMREINMEDGVIVRPTYLSICAADVRYYFGRRKKEVLRKKLPMALIHDGIGKVVYDASGNFEIGENVVMVPNVPGKSLSCVKENYLSDSIFLSSGTDGFMQDMICMSSEQLVKLPSEDNVYVLCELLSIAINALSEFETTANKRRNSIGVWGDGNVGFVVALALKYIYPDVKVTIIGKHSKNLQYFAFSDETYLVDELPDNVHFDHCFECVGGIGSGEAIDQIIEHILPAGSVGLLGVSENAVPIDTRMVLEKGLKLYGNSRSSRIDFEKSVELIRNLPEVAAYLRTIISQTHIIRNERDIYTAFEQNEMSDFKTIMKWSV